MNRKLPVVLFFICLALVARGQQFPGGLQNPNTFGGRQAMPTSTTGTSGSIIDDSTKVIYGPTTTRYVLEDDIFNNRRKLYTLDTTMDEVHRFTYVQKSQNLLQDLGVLGTPIHPVFVALPDQLGTQPGYSVFAPYGYQTMNVKYYDTKSPFTDMYVALGGNSQNILRFDMAQNITPRWNAGFDVQRFTSQKHFGTTGSSDPYKLLAQNWSFLAHTNYRSKNDKYTLLAHFNNMNHSIDEQGGLVPGTIVTGTPIIGDALLSSGSTSVQGPHGWEIRNGVHAYQQYVLRNGFQAYHRFDYRIQKNFYQDDFLTRSQAIVTPTDTIAFYPVTPINDASKVEHWTRFRLLENQFGVKGIAQYKGASFNYRAYLRLRNYKQFVRYNTTDSLYNENEIPRTESFVGGWLGYYFPDSLSRVTAELEYQVGGGYRLQGEFTSKWVTAGYSSMFVDPTLLQERFQSILYNWRNNFSLRGYNHAYGKINLRYKQLRIEPQLDYYLLSNYVYFDTDAVARQASGSFSVLRTGLGYHIPLGKFLIGGQAFYTVQSRTDILRTPPFFINTRLQYEFIYAKVLHIQAGIDLHYKSPYYADAYMPLTQQFYLQNSQKVEGYLLADVYANLRVNRTRLFVKLTHANQGLLAPMYYVAPNFLQVSRGFAFGVDWYLFD